MKHIKIIAKVHKMLVDAASIDDAYGDEDPPKDPEEYDEWQCERDKYDWSPNELYMLGVNKQGIIMAAEFLDSEGAGCEYMPGITTAELTRAYIKLSKKNLTPIGYAVTVPWFQRGGDAIWDGDGAQFIDTGMWVLEFSPKPIGIKSYNERSKRWGDIDDVKVHKTKTAK